MLRNVSFMHSGGTCWGSRAILLGLLWHGVSCGSIFSHSRELLRFGLHLCLRSAAALRFEVKPLCCIMG